MPYFYCDNLIGERVKLDEEESRHISKVIRKKVGDQISITNGKGELCKAIIDEIGKNCIVKIIHREHFSNKKTNMHIAISLPKNSDRVRFLIEKITELGIDEITPILSMRSERKKINIDRLNKFLISSIKQSERVHIPKINEECNFNDFVSKKHEGVNLMAHCNNQFERNPIKFVQKDLNFTILIGPEGDFHENEIKVALENGYHGLFLSENILRTETAAISAVSYLSIINS